MEKKDYLELAKEQYDNLQEECLDEDRNCVGAENELDYDINNLKFKIKVQGYWDRSDWFEWTVTDELGNEIITDTHYCF